MLQNAYLFAKIGADTAENVRNFADIWATAGLPALHALPEHLEVRERLRVALLDFRDAVRVPRLLQA